MHPVSITGGAEQSRVGLILRNFTLDGLAEQRTMIERLVVEASAGFPGGKATSIFSDQYRNMKEVLDQHPQVVQRALDAMARCGLEPERRSVRGGTDGARLSFMGLPCPNLFAGEHAFHSKKEWVSLEDMELAVRVAIEVVRVV